MPKFFIILTLSLYLQDISCDNNVSLISLDKSDFKIRCIKSKQITKCVCDYTQNGKATRINPAVIENTDENSPLAINSPILILDSTDIRRKIILPADLLAILSLPSDLNFHIIDFVDARNLSLEDFIKSFFQIKPEFDTLFVIKQAMFSGGYKVDSLFIEIRVNKVSRITFESSGQSSRFLMQPESNLLRRQTIGMETKNKEQGKLLREFLKVRRGKSKYNSI